MSKKKIEIVQPELDTNDGVEVAPSLKYETSAYAIVNEDGEYKILQIKVNLEERLVGSVMTLDQDSDSYEIREKFMIEMEDRIYEVD